MARDVERHFGVVCNELIRAEYDLSVVYDIGANDGRWTAGHGRRICPGAHFYQFEANLKCTLKHKGSDITRFIEVLSDTDGKEVKFYEADLFSTENTGYSYYQENSPGYEQGKYTKYKTKKLDTFVAEKNLPMPNIVKMDTQGSEVDILRGGAKTLSKAYAIHCEVPIVEYNKGAPGFSEYLSEFRKLGFLPTGVEHIAIRNGVVSQMDVTFMKATIIEKIWKYKQRYTEL